MSISIFELEKALLSVEEVVALPKTAIIRDATIKRFEFTLELVWKTAKKLMGTSASAPKMVIREMAQQSLIHDPIAWLKYIDDRNLSSDFYNEAVADLVYDLAKKFAGDCRLLLTRLRLL